MSGSPATLPEARPVRVFLVAENAVLRDNLELLLRAEGMVLCGWAREEAAAIDEAARADLVVVSLSARRQAALELVRQLGALPGGAPSLVLSVHDDDHSIREALAAGASGFVPSRKAPEALLQAIREVVAGRVFTSRPLDPVRESAAP